MDPKTPHPLMGDLAAIATRDGLTGVVLAQRLQVHPSTITRLMSKGMQPSLDLVRRMNEQFPELQPRCAELLRIGYDDDPDSERREHVEVPA